MSGIRIIEISGVTLHPFIVEADVPGSFEHRVMHPVPAGTRLTVIYDAGDESHMTTLDESEAMVALMKETQVRHGN